MKDNKNVVFALNSFTTNVPISFSNHDKQKDIVFVEQGFLLFPDESKADSFLELCDSMNKAKKTSNYTKFSYVAVSDYIAGRVETQQNFYVSNANTLEKIIESVSTLINETSAVSKEVDNDTLSETNQTPIKNKI